MSGIYKNGSDELICKAEIDTDVGNKHTDAKGEGGVGWIAVVFLIFDIELSVCPK